MLTTGHAPGVPVWVDLVTPDVEAARTPPVDLEGVGRSASLVDPFGAAFAVLTSVAG